jgi:hypothetical protein
LELGEMGHWCNSARGRGVRAWCGAGMAVVCLQRPTVTALSSPSSHRQGYGSLPSFHGACRVLQVNEFNPLNFSRGPVVGWWACRVGIIDSWQEKHLPPLMWGDLKLKAQVNRHIVGIAYHKLMADSQSLCGGWNCLISSSAVVMVVMAIHRL